jgi:hypothetical protein
MAVGERSDSEGVLAMRRRRFRGAILKAQSLAQWYGSSTGEVQSSG